MRPISMRYKSSRAVLLSVGLASFAAADPPKSAAFDCDGGPGAGGFRMVATYYFYPDRPTPNRAAVSIDGKTTELTVRSHDDATGWTFYSTTPPEISLRWVGPDVQLSRGPKVCKCVEVAAAEPLPPPTAPKTP